MWNQFVDTVFTANESAKRQRSSLLNTTGENNTNTNESSLTTLSVNAAIETQIAESQLQQLSQQTPQIPKPIILSRIKPPINLIRFSRI